MNGEPSLYTHPFLDSQYLPITAAMRSYLLFVSRVGIALLECLCLILRDV